MNPAMTDNPNTLYAQMLLNASLSSSVSEARQRLQTPWQALLQFHCSETEQNHEEDDSDHDSNRRDDVRRSFQLECSFHVCRRRVPGQNYTYNVPPGVYIGWQWRSFVSYLCQLVSAAILWVKLIEMFVTVMSLKYSLCRQVDDHVGILIN